MNEIEKIGKIMCEEFNSESCGNECECCNKELAEKLIDAGFGDVKQAVRKFAEKIYDEFDKMEEDYHMATDWNGESAVSWCSSKVKELVKEVCGE